MENKDEDDRLDLFNTLQHSGSMRDTKTKPESRKLDFNVFLVNLANVPNLLKQEVKVEVSDHVSDGFPRVWIQQEKVFLLFSVLV